MSSADENRRIPRQRGAADEAALPVEALCPEAQRQWDLLHKLRQSVRNVAYQRTGLPTTALDDIESRVYLAFFTRLRNSGPLNSRFGRLESYLWKVTRREAADYLRELKERAEEFVGDATYLLDGEGGRAVHPSPEDSLMVLIPAMQVLSEELSDLQLKVFVLAEGYGLKSPYIATLLGGTTTKDSVRDALRHARSKLASDQVGSRLRVLAED
ncbi:sigma-70 family RNA polymerase sigma factor [Streptomyces sp. NPDC052302]|uniref:sigma-70 family RNA polymerase sigma factor n=1 Tax=Streptomyces sp. NPDC052302 TaxID=3365688 RepID=UPI0037CE3E96